MKLILGGFGATPFPCWIVSDYDDTKKRAEGFGGYCKMSSDIQTFFCENSEGLGG